MSHPEKVGATTYLALGDSMTDFEMLRSSAVAVVIDRGRIAKDASTVVLAASDGADDDGHDAVKCVACDVATG